MEISGALIHSQKQGCEGLGKLPRAQLRSECWRESYRFRVVKCYQFSCDAIESSDESC